MNHNLQVFNDVPGYAGWYFGPADVVLERARVLMTESTIPFDKNKLAVALDEAFPEHGFKERELIIEPARYDYGQLVGWAELMLGLPYVENTGEDLEDRRTVVGVDEKANRVLVQSGRVENEAGELVNLGVEEADVLAFAAAAGVPQDAIGFEVIGDIEPTILESGIPASG